MAFLRISVSEANCIYRRLNQHEWHESKSVPRSSRCTVVTDSSSKEEKDARYSHVTHVANPVRKQSHRELWKIANGEACKGKPGWTTFWSELVSNWVSLWRCEMWLDDSVSSSACFALSSARWRAFCFRLTGSSRQFLTKGFRKVISMCVGYLVFDRCIPARLDPLLCSVCSVPSTTFVFGFTQMSFCYVSHIFVHICLCGH